MQLADHQITTREVRSWKGVHLLHFRGSSCSQKVRTLLAEKGVDYVSHHVNLVRNEHVTPWFIGINPRGVVPVLVHDGDVHIESNDIMAYVDTLPSRVPPFFPADVDERRFAESSLSLEDSLHTDLRNLTMEFLFPNRIVAKSSRTLASYESSGAADASRDAQVAWWRAFSTDGGVPREALKRSVLAFHEAFEVLDRRLADRAWLVGTGISVLEIAWFIALHRLTTAGYPLETHPHLAAHYRRLLARNAFAREVDLGWPARAVIVVYGAYRRLGQTALRDLYVEAVGAEMT